ncbi:hypothetical protein [Nocardiopsis sp. Huas11]|uniref:hypothetical protein n=1 Tax=Nocardiopsis sp. Huas11 TaxID=2183912 RepID=UPI000EB12D2D|nr:hypothetical protein [Nocardiopsis sp. Huas11]
MDAGRGSGRAPFACAGTSDGEYREVTRVYGEDVFATELPFPARIVPHRLVAQGPWRKRVGGAADA